MSSMARIVTLQQRGRWARARILANGSACSTAEKSTASKDFSGDWYHMISHTALVDNSEACLIPGYSSNVSDYANKCTD